MEYLQRVTRIRHLAREYWFELLIAVMAIAGMLELVVGRDYPGAPTMTALGQRPSCCGSRAASVCASPLSVRRPGDLLDPRTGPHIRRRIADPVHRKPQRRRIGGAALLGNLRSRLKAGVGLVLIVVGILVVVGNIPGDQTASQLTFITLRFVVAWIAGYALRERAEQAEAAECARPSAERERESAARVAVAEERTRIARELHDIVAHAVSVMVLQVGAVRHKLPDAMAEDRDALKGVERAGRTALAEMRRLLAAMRADGDEAELVPQPGLDGLSSLLADVGRAGLPVELHLEGQPYPLPRGVDLSAYRIVQEGLTNVLKHAGASDADVIVRYRPDEVEIEVRDNGDGASTGDGLGHGLVGIRERVKIYGGEMSARAEPEGGFVLSTRLPVVEEGA